VIACLQASEMEVLASIFLGDVTSTGNFKPGKDGVAAKKPTSRSAIDPRRATSESVSGCRAKTSYFLTSQLIFFLSFQYPSLEVTLHTNEQPLLVVNLLLVWLCWWIT